MAGKRPAARDQEVHLRRLLFLRGLALGLDAQALHRYIAAGLARTLRVRPRRAAS